MRKTNPKKHNRYSVILVVALLLAMLSTTVVGCGKPSTTDDSPGTSEVVSETLSTSEVSESILEEPSEEIISEELSEEIVEEVDLSQYTTENMKVPVDLIHDMDYNELKIVVWGFLDEATGGAKAILSDGDSFKIREDDVLWLYYPESNVDIQSEKDYIGIGTMGQDYNILLYVDNGENIEVPITATTPDGTVYEITVYLTKE